MEARLFVLSIWCGIYGQIIRFLSRRGEALKNAAIVMFVNALFWATFMAMSGMLVASYSERMDQTNKFTILFGGVGFLIGAIVGFRKSRDEAKREFLIKDNLEWADTGFSAILLASFVMFFIVQAFKIPSGSMRMTFIEGDHLFVNKFIYGVPVPLTDKKFFSFKNVEPNDIVIFRFPTKDRGNPHYGKDFIKRTIALEGQQVQIVNKKVFVDGLERMEPFSQHADRSVYPALRNIDEESYQQMWERGEFAEGFGNDVRDNFGPITVPPGHIFVMGDNRDRSFDSRFWGPLDTKAVKGKAWLLYWPFKRFHVAK